MGRFELGRVLATPGALELLERAQLSPTGLLLRHIRGDWGDLCPDDVQANENALETGARLLSSYQLAGSKLWVITEADRSATTLLLPEEY